MRPRYYHWHKVKRISTANKLDPRIIWFHLKVGRQSQYRSVPLRGADGTGIKYTIPDAVARELMMLDQEAAGRVTTDPDVRLPTGTQREIVVVRQLMEEAIASSLLEGAATTRQEAKKMIRSGRPPRTTGERMVLNNYATILHIRQHADRPLTREFLLELQEMLTEETLEHPDQVGRFRTSDDAVDIVDEYGSVMYTPPPASELEERVQAICDFANARDTEDAFIHPVVKACLLHFQIAVDHPFCDGNGRTARAVFYWHLLRNKYWLFEFMPISTLIRESPARYATAYLYSETDEYDATYFLMYNAGILRRAREQMNEYIRRKFEEQRRAASLLSADVDLNLRQRQVLNKFAQDPDRRVTIEMHATEYNISYQTARTDLLDLANRDYLGRIKDGNTYNFIRGQRLEEIERAN